MNKKLLLVLFALSSSVHIFAQNAVKDSTANSFKPAAKSIATELNVNPFNGNISLNNAVNQIKLRYFTKEDIAVRLGFNINSTNSISETNYPYATNPQRFKDERKGTTMGLNFGIEKHFKGSKRLSPYIGADLMIENQSTEQELINGQIITKVKNGTYETILYNNNIPYQQLVSQGYFKYGVNLFSGFDFYMAKNFFFGYEFNLGFTQTNNKNPEVIVTGASNNQTISDIENTNFSFGTKLMNGIRIGYIF